MIRKCLQPVVCLLMLLPSGSFAEGAKDKVTDEQFVKMTQDLLAAEVRRDTAAMDGYFTSSYTHTHAVGLIESRATFIATFSPSGMRRYKDADLTQIKVRSFDSSAIVSGHERIGADGGDHHYSFVAVWVQDQGKWRVATWVTSPNYPPPPGAPAH